MMQFIEIKESLKCIRTVQKIVFIAVTFFVSTFASTQLDIRAGGVSGEISPESGVYAGGLTIQQIYNGIYSLTPKLELMLENRFDGLKSLYWGTSGDEETQNYPLQEKLIPSSNLASVGLRWTGLGDLQVLFRNHLYLNSLWISPYYLTFMDSVKLEDPSILPSPRRTMARDARTHANVFWSLPLGRIAIAADLNFIASKYRRIAYGYDFIEGDVPVDKRTLYDNDLWSGYAFSCRLIEEIYIKIDATLKQNLSDHKFMNLYQYRVELNGAHDFPQKNQVIWVGGLKQYQRSNRKDMREDYLEALEIMDIRLIPARPLLYVYLRDVLTISRGCFLKGTAIFETGRDLFKQRYELSLRKAWINSSYIEPGYCTSLNGLFPLQSAYIKSNIQATKSFGITPMIKVSWDGPQDSKDNVSFLKMLSSLELSYAIRNRTEILLGGGYTCYNKDNVTGFPNRFELYCGIQSIIP